MTIVGSIENGGWSRGRWFWTVAIFAGAQVAAVYFLSDYEIEDKEWPSQPIRIRWNPIPADANRHTDIDFLEDPTLFTLAHPRNFSGSAWLHAPEFPYEPKGRILPATWFRLNSARFGEGFAEIVESAFSKEGEPSLTSNSTIPEIPEDGPWVLGRATLRIEGSAARLRPNPSHSPPAAEPGIVLKKCVVGVWVNSRGEPFSPVLQNSSGSNSVDQEALAYVNASRFEPVSREAQGAPTKQIASRFVYFVFEWLASRPGPNVERQNR